MELNTIALIVVTIGFLLILSALFSGMETAMLSLSEVRLRARAESEEQLPRVLQGWLDDPLHVLTTLLIGNNAVNITAVAFSRSVVPAKMAAASFSWISSSARSIT